MAIAPLGDYINQDIAIARQAGQDRRLAAIKENASSPDAARLRQACQGMESIFLGLLLKEMRATVPTDPLTSHGEEIFRSFLDDELAKTAAQAGGIGLADMLYRQLAPSEVPRRQK